MANAYSTGKSVLVEPPLGAYTNSWNSPVNSNFSVIDATISGTTTIDASTFTPGVPFAVLVFQNFEQNPTPQTNPLAGQNLRIRVVGALSFDVSVIIPAGYPGLWVIDNQTTGAFSVSVKTTAATTVPIEPPQGFMSIVFSDGTNVRYADQGVSQIASGNTVRTASIILYATATPPAGYLRCDGAAVSRIAYADLFSIIGTTWGAGDGVTTFNVPNIPSTTPPATHVIKT